MTNGTYYKVKVRAVNALGDGAESAEIGPFKPNTVPGAPTSVTASSGQNAQVFVSWSNPASNGGTALTDYVIQYSTSATFASGITTWSHAASTSTFATITGLTNGTTYYFRIAAVNNGSNGGTGAYSSISAAARPYTTPGAPSVPTITWGTGNSTTDTVAWTAPTSNGGDAIDKYEVIASSNGFAAYDVYTDITTLSKAIDSGYTTTGRQVAVRAHNAAGWGSFSSGTPGIIGGWTNNFNSYGDSQTQTEGWSDACAGSCYEGQYCECGAQYRYRTRSRTQYRSTQYWSRTGNTNSSTTYGSWPSSWSDWSYTAYGAWSACDATGTQENYTGNYVAGNLYSSNRGYPFSWQVLAGGFVWGNDGGASGGIGCGGGAGLAGPSQVYRCNRTGTYTTNNGTTVGDACFYLYCC